MNFETVIFQSCCPEILQCKIQETIEIPASKSIQSKTYKCSACGSVMLGKIVFASIRSQCITANSQCRVHIAKTILTISLKSQLFTNRTVSIASQ